MQRKNKVVVIASLVLLFALAAPLSQTSAATANPDTVVPGQSPLSEASGGTRGTLGSAAAQALRSGPLSNDPAMLAQRKAQAAAEVGQAPQPSPEPGIVSPTPTVLLGKNGLSDNNVSPSDSTGAIGTTRYIETVNEFVGIYDRNLNLINSTDLATWWLEGGSNSFDPQIMWDATTNRFYYAGDVVFSSTDNRLAFGFSTSASPSNATTDWCQYQISYGSEFPDYPKLGDSQDFAIIGVNTFAASGSYRGSDIMAISKPAAGTTCPAASTFKFGQTKNITVGTTPYFTPTPANSIDRNGTGWIVTRAPSLPATTIGLFKVTRDATTGNPVIPATGSAMTVPAYDVPPPAPQSSTGFTIDTSDTRFPQAVAAVDPAHSSKFAVWTQHAIKGGAGSKERWYEIDPVNRVLLQTGDVQSSTQYYFDGAISPDRKVSGTTTAFGATMLLNFTASGRTTFPSINMVSKRGTNTISAVKTVKTSPGPDIDFTCPTTNTCRWGDYAAATPDPNAPTTGAAGIVWSTSMWTLDGRTTGGTSGVSWQSWNWESQP